MYLIQQELYNLREKRIPCLEYNKEDFLKWLINIVWQYKEQEEADLWNMHWSPIEPYYHKLQLLLHIYGVDINNFEKIIQSIDDIDIMKQLEIKYSNEYSRDNNQNVHIYPFQLFSGFTFLPERFIVDYRNGKIAKMKICKECGDVFYENEAYWSSKGLYVPKRCLQCRVKEDNLRLI